MMTITTKEIAESTEYSNGYDSGNYDAAYTSETISPLAWKGRTDNYRAAYILGFFSSYETSEVPSEWRDLVDSLRA